MPDIDEPLPLPTNPQTVADLLPHLPIPYDYGAIRHGLRPGVGRPPCRSAGREPDAARCIACADDRRPIPDLCATSCQRCQTDLYGPNFTRLDASRLTRSHCCRGPIAWRCSRSRKNFRRLIVSGRSFAFVWQVFLRKNVTLWTQFANRERYFPAWAVFLVSEMHQKRYVLRLFLRDATG
jgi:hypothetical protein